MCTYCILRQKPLTLQNGIARNGDKTCLTGEPTRTDNKSISFTNILPINQ